MAEPQDTINLVNSTDQLSATEILRAKVVLDEHAPRGKQDVLQARMRLARTARMHGVTFPPAPGTPAKEEPSKGQAILGGVVLLGILFGVGSCIVAVANNRDDDEATSDPDAGDEIGASIVCEDFVERQLRAPGTADFASYSDQVITGGPTEFVVQSYVDSENAFGALLRTNYTCTVTYAGDDSWNLVDLTTA